VKDLAPSDEQRREAVSKTKKAKKNPCTGGGFDEFLREDGIYEAVQIAAMKRILTMRLAEAMRKCTWPRSARITARTLELEQST